MTHSSGTPQSPGSRDRGAWPFAPVNSESTTPETSSPTTPETSSPTTFATSPSSSSAPAPIRRSGAQSSTPNTPPDEGEVEDEPGRRRPPRWLWIVLGVVVVGAIAAVVMFLMRPETPEPLEPEVITLPEPTPTIDPVERTAGSPFFESLPVEVLAYALVDYGEWDEAVIDGALEGYYQVYSDGSDTITLYTGQWRDAEGANAAYDRAVAAGQAAAGEEPAADAAEETEETEETTEGAETPAAAPAPEDGIVEVDGEQVGRWTLIPRADGTGSLWWTNQTALFQLDGPVEEIRDVFTAFPL